MPKNRQPIDLIKAKGKKHLSEREYEERKSQELDVPFVEVEPPDYLTTKKQKEEFNHYAGMLVELGIFTELDVDCLARYILAKELYINYTKQLRKIATKANTVHKWAVIDELATLCDSDETGTLEDLKKLLEKLVRRQRGEDMTVIMNLQDKAFRQAQSAARELGLTITSRCKIVVPPPPEDDDDEL